jgi:signal transduction histidine kinase
VLRRILNRSRPGRKQTTLLILLLLLTFAVAGVISWIGRTEGKQHEQTYENGLLTSAAFASAGYADELSKNVTSVVGWTFRDILNAPLETQTPDDIRKIDLVNLDGLTSRCDCKPSEELLFRYTYDFATGKLVVDEPASALLRMRIERALNDTTLPARQFWRFSVAIGESGASDPALVSIVRFDPQSGERVLGMGVGVRPKFLKTAFTPVDSFNLFLPSPENARPMPDRFAIKLMAGNDTISQYGSSSQYAVRWKPDPALGNFTVIASVSPTRFDVVAGSSAPISRVPLYGGLLMLLAVLITAALILTKRQGELAEARTDFVSNVSHEFRTPLAQIRMFAETLLLGRVRNDTDKRRSLEIIDQEAKRLTALVDNVLQLGRSERGVATVAPTQIRLGPTIREAVERFAELPRALSVEFRTEVEDRLAAMVDPNALRQIVDNLLDNAVKYGPSGQRVNIGLAMFEQNARLWVDDEGPGIPLRERDRVFEPFYRSTLHMQSAAAGSGIGLAVVRELSDLLEGRVWAESAPGGGARIIVEFPNAYLQPEEAAGGWAVA